jgi:hypothetical protein
MVETPRPGGGVERRALGEFVSGRGELASYAFGWVTEAESAPREGRMTVGIGIGNEGGASFHWAVVRHEKSYAYRLVDEPFERVPQGGPDITADEARAHETLRFVFWVGDTVMRQDPRAIWMYHWLTGSMAIETPQVAERTEPVLLVGLDDHERLPWQLIGTSDAGDDGKIEHLHHHLEQDPTLLEPVAQLVPGQQALRDAPGGPWRYVDTPPEDA